MQCSASRCNQCAHSMCIAYCICTHLVVISVNAAAAFVLGRRCCSCPYWRCLHTVIITVACWCASFEWGCSSALDGVVASLDGRQWHKWQRQHIWTVAEQSIATRIVLDTITDVQSRTTSGFWTISVIVATESNCRRATAWRAPAICMITSKILLVPCRLYGCKNRTVVPTVECLMQRLYAFDVYPLLFS